MPRGKNVYLETFQGIIKQKQSIKQTNKKPTKINQRVYQW